MNAFVLRVGAFRAVPFHQQLIAFRLGEKGQDGNRLIGVDENIPKETFVMSDPAANRSRIKEICVVFALKDQPALFFNRLNDRSKLT